MQVGEVSELWRFPVKSMGGDRVASTEVSARWGFPGDRGWALRDARDSGIRNAKRINSLLQFHARYLDEPVADATPPVEITFPDGSVGRSDDDNEIHHALSAATGRDVALCPRRSSDERGLFDAMPLSLATTTAMDSLRGLLPESSIDPRRFRMNIIVDTAVDTGAEAGAFPEFGWLGRRLRVGGVLCEVTTRVRRCVMVGLPQAELPRDSSVLKTLAARTDMDFGAYLRVLEPGRISEGDGVHLL